MPPAWDWFPGLNISGGSAGIGPLFFHLLPFIEQENLYKSSRFTTASPPQDYFDFGYNKELQQRQLPLYNCPLDPTLPDRAGAPGVAPIAGSSYAGNFLVFGKVDAAAVAVSPFGRPDLARSFPDGTSTTLLLGEKYAVVGVEPAPGGQGQVSRGGCHWDYWGQNSYAAFFALYDPKWTAPDSVGPVPAVPNDPRDSRPQVRPDPNAPATNPGRCSTGHAGGMNAAWADGSVRPVAPSVESRAWWALVTPAGGEVVTGE
jgi:prepilin-type processing-associated H-X9-DG protein